MVDNTSAIARLANRVLMVAKQEADNSEDPLYVNQLNAASEQLQAGKASSFTSFTCDIYSLRH